MTGLRERVAKGFFWSAAHNWGVSAITLVVFLVLARLLEPADFGLLAIGSAFMAFLQVFKDQGFGLAIIQRPNLEPAHRYTAFWTTVATGAVLAGLTVLAAGPVARGFDQPLLASILRWQSLTLVLTSFGEIQRALLRRELAFRAISLRALLASLVSGTVAITLALLGFGVWSLVVKNLVNEAVESAAMWTATRWRPELKFSWRHFKEMAAFGVHIVGTNVMNFLVTRSDDLFIGYFLGPTPLGYYAVGYRILRLLLTLLTSVTSTVAVPALSRLQDELPRMRRAFYSLTQLTAVVAFPTFVGIALVAHDMVPALYGEKWLPSVPVIQLLSLVGVLNCVLYFHSAALVAAGKPSWRFALTFVDSLTSVALYAVAARWGLVAFCWAYVVRCYVISLPLWLRSTVKAMGLEVGRYLRQYAATVLGLLVMSVAVLAVNHLLRDVGSHAVRLAANVVAGVAVYGLFMLRADPEVLRRGADFARLAAPGRKR